MKVSGIISALIFAHVALGQAADSTSAATTSVSGTKSASSTKSGTKSASSPAATPTGSTGSTGSSDQFTETISGDANPLIPSDISATCSTFLTSLNSDTTVSGCLTSLNTALSSFTSGSGSSSAVSKTLTSLCSVNSCSSSTMRSKLTEFETACSNDFASNTVVAKQYDIWYALVPFKAAICAKDTDTQDFCLPKMASSSSNTNTRRSDVSHAARYLSKRSQAVMANTDTYRSTHLMYLFLSPSTPANELCTTCTKQIMAEYMAFGTAHRYPSGISNSPLLGGQSELWAAIKDECPSNFTTDISNIAGTPSPDDLAGGAISMAASYFTTLAAAFAAAFALF